MSNPTLKDIAEQADVSVATVSMVLNNKGNISQDVRENVYRIAQKITKEAAVLDTARVATPLIPAVRESFPEVESAVRFQMATWDSLVEREETKYYEDWVMIAENDIFDVFTIPFIRGNPEKALERPRTVVITERVAQRYFGFDDPVGQTLILWGDPVEVTGVVTNYPKNTHLKYDVIISGKLEFRAEKSPGVGIPVTIGEGGSGRDGKAAGGWEHGTRKGANAKDEGVLGMEGAFFRADMLIEQP